MPSLITKIKDVNQKAWLPIEKLETIHSCGQEPKTKRGWFHSFLVSGCVEQVQDFKSGVAWGQHFQGEWSPVYFKPKMITTELIYGSKSTYN